MTDPDSVPTIRFRREDLYEVPVSPRRVSSDRPSPSPTGAAALALIGAACTSMGLGGCIAVLLFIAWM